MSLISDFQIEMCRSAIDIWRALWSTNTVLICVLFCGRVEFSENFYRIESGLSALWKWWFHFNIYSSSKLLCPENVLWPVTICTCHTFFLKKNANLMCSKVLCYHECHLHVWHIWSKRNKIVSKISIHLWWIWVSMTLCYRLINHRL